VGVILVLFRPLYQQVNNVEVSPPQEISNKDATTSAQIDDGPIRADKTFTISDYKEEELPVKIVIPSLSLDLPITPAKVVNNTWETSETNASFGLGSTAPGKIGNTVIFAHARTGLFGDLRKLKKDDVIYVFTKGDWYSYKAEEFKEVLPSAIEVIAPTSTETLTLYTCSGYADTKRLVVHAKRI
jgi:LPXTG-site transpeptidase (sortase) family protein